MGGYSQRLLGVSDEPQQTGGYSQRLLGSEQQPPPPEPAKNEEGWLEWLSNSIKGRQDPAYAGTPSVFSQHTEALRDPTGYAALAGASDAQMADIIQKQLGNKFVRREKDQHGYDVFTTRGHDGQEQRGYVNRPGLDTEDAWRAFHGAMPYAVTGGGAALAGRGAGLGINALLQGGAATATSVGGDVAQQPLGSEQGIELDKAATTGAFGAAGPLVGAGAGALWKRFVTIPGLIDGATGQLTAKGAEFARQAGLEPQNLSAEFARRFAKGVADAGDPEIAATRAGMQQFDIPATRGQITKDPRLLMQEEAMRRGLSGDRASSTMQGLYDEQADAVARAALGESRSLGTSPTAQQKPSIARLINANRNPRTNEFDRSPGAMGDDIGAAIRGARETARDLESEAWNGTRNLEATPDAFELLPNMLNRQLGDRIVDTQVTPAAARMAQEMDRFISGEAPDAVAGVLRQEPVRRVDQMRRRLLGIYNGAAPGEDAAAARALYDGFNDWIGEAAAANLLRGDPEAAMRIATARGFTREVRGLFAPGGPGQRSPAAARIGKIIDGRADSGESVITALFGGAGTRTPANGVASSLASIRTALDRFGGDGAKQAWDDIRLAYWNRTVLNKNGQLIGTPPTKGEPFGAVSLSNSIKRAMSEQRTVFNLLYSQQERRQIAELVRGLDAIAFKPPNASGSGYTAVSLISDKLMRLLEAFGLGTPARMAINLSGIDRALGAANASRAVSGALRPRRPNLGPASAAVGQQYDRQSGR